MPIMAGSWDDAMGTMLLNILGRHKEKTHRVLIHLALLIAGAAVLFIAVDIHRSLWLDEAYSVWVSDRGFSDIVATLQNDSTPPFYYLLLSIWIRLFGIGPLAVKSLSVLFFGLSLAAVYSLGATVYDKKAGVLAAFFYVLSPLAIHHATNVRMYSLLGLLGVLSYLFYFRAFHQKPDSNSDLVGYAGVTIIGTFTHYWFMFNPMSHVCCALLFGPAGSRKRQLGVIAFALLPFFVFWGPSLWQQMHNGSTSYMSVPGIFEGIRQTLLGFYGGVYSLPVYAALTGLGLVGWNRSNIRIGLPTGWRRFFAGHPTAVFATSFLVSLLAPIFISQVKPVFMQRYTIVSLLPMIMLLAGWVGRFGQRRLILFCCYGMAAACMILFVSNRSKPPEQCDRTAAEYIIRHASPNDVLIYTSLSRLAIDYYLRLNGRESDLIRISFPRELESHPVWRNLNRQKIQSRRLRTEAHRLAAQLGGTLSENGRIWMFYGRDPSIGGLIKAALEKRFLLEAEKKMAGSFFDSVMVYRTP